MDNYPFRGLECFLVVAEELNFTRAAAQLGIAQPSLSRHIHALEERLGTRLFERVHRQVSLTAAGRLLQAGAAGPLLQLQRAIDLAERAGSLDEGSRLEIGFISSLLSSDMIQLFQRYRQQHPQVHLTLHDWLPGDQVRALAEGRLDGGFIGLASRDRLSGIAFQPWKREALKLFLPPGHALAGQRAIALKAVARDPMVAVAGGSFPAFASAVRDLCRKAGFRPRVIHEANRAQAVVAMVAAGAGTAILPDSMSRVADKGITAVDILDRTAQVIYAFAYRSRGVTPVLRSFLALLKAEWERG